MEGWNNIGLTLPTVALTTKFYGSMKKVEAFNVNNVSTKEHDTLAALVDFTHHHLSISMSKLIFQITLFPMLICTNNLL